MKHYFNVLKMSVLKYVFGIIFIGFHLVMIEGQTKVWKLLFLWSQLHNDVSGIHHVKLLQPSEFQDIVTVLHLKVLYFN